MSQPAQPKAAAEAGKRPGARRAEPDPKPANRRESYRRKPRSGAAFTCRLLPSEGRPDLFKTLLDVSEGGVRMVLKTPLEEGDQLELQFDHPSGRGLKWLLAYVVWSMPTADGNACVGARFLRNLNPSELRMMTEA